MSQRSRNRPKAPNVPSLLLQENENEVLFQTMGCLCATLATGVVQLYLADPPDRNRWSKRCCGVACFVKDSSKKSFFIRVYDIKKQQTLWEQELYNQFTYKTPREYFHTFESENCVVGLNFASEDEASKFKRAIDGKLNERRQKRLDRKRQTQRINQNQGGAGTQKMGGSSPASQPVSLTADIDRSSVIKNNQKNAEKKSNAKKKLTKADIGTPSNFVHVSHVGWDPETGFDMNNLEPDMRTLFQSVGIKPGDDVDKETVDFIYDFLEKHGGIEAVQKEIHGGGTRSASQTPGKMAGGGTRSASQPPGNIQAPPPPPPSRLPAAPPQLNRAVAPLPPAPPSRSPCPIPPRGGAPPPPPSRVPPGTAKAPMSAPPPPPCAPAPPPPPPPPPPGAPPPSGAPPPPPVSGGGDTGRGALLNAIRSGTTLKHADANSEPKGLAPGDNRGQLLDSIRQGAKLKKVDSPTDRPASDSNESNGLVGALARALANRQKQIHGSDDDDDSDYDDEVEDDEEWED